MLLDPVVDGDGHDLMEGEGWHPERVQPSLPLITDQMLESIVAPLFWNLKKPGTYVAHKERWGMWFYIIQNDDGSFLCHGLRGKSTCLYEQSCANLKVAKGLVRSFMIKEIKGALSENALAPSDVPESV